MLKNVIKGGSPAIAPVNMSTSGTNASQLPDARAPGIESTTTAENVQSQTEAEYPKREASTKKPNSMSDVESIMNQVRPNNSRSEATTAMPKSVATESETKKTKKKKKTKKGKTNAEVEIDNINFTLLDYVIGGTGDFINAAFALFGRALAFASKPAFWALLIPLCTLIFTIVPFAVDGADRRHVPASVDGQHAGRQAARVWPAPLAGAALATDPVRHGGTCTRAWCACMPRCRACSEWVAKVPWTCL
jgi:hypothetical protein